MARLYIKTPWSYKTDSWVDVTSIDFNSKKIHEDKIFDRQNILQFFSGVFKDYKLKYKKVGVLSIRIVLV